MIEKLDELAALKNHDLFREWSKAHDAARKKSAMPEKTYGFPAEEGTLRAAITEVLDWDTNPYAMKYVFELLINYFMEKAWETGDSFYKISIEELSELSALCTMYMLDYASGYNLTDAIKVKSEAAGLMGNTFTLEGGIQRV